MACPAFAWDRVTVSVRTVVLRWRHAKNIDEWRRRMVGRGFERKASNRTGTSNSQSSKSHNLWLLRESELLRKHLGESFKILDQNGNKNSATENCNGIIEFSSRFVSNFILRIVGFI